MVIHLQLKSSASCPPLTPRTNPAAARNPRQTRLSLKITGALHTHAKDAGNIGLIPASFDELYCKLYKVLI
jgi:hypothetical protein